MRFNADDVRLMLKALKVLAAGDDAHRHDRDWAEEKVEELGPRLVDAYCAAVGIELPID